MAKRMVVRVWPPRGSSHVIVRSHWRRRLARTVLASTVAVAAVACGGSTDDASAPSDAESTAVTEPVGATKSEVSSQSATGAAKSSLIKAGTGPCCLVARDDGIWVMNLRDATVQHVDPQNNQPGEPVSTFPFDAMIGAGDKMLLATPEEYEVALFDPATGKVGQSIKIEGGVRGMAFDANTNTVWVGSATDGTLTHIDADSGRVLDEFTVDGLPEGGDMIPNGNSELWVVTFSGELLKVDLAQQRVVTRLQPFGAADAEVFLVPAGGHLWATSIQEPTLLRIDPRTGKIERRGTIDAAGEAFPRLSAAPDGTLWVAAAPDRIEELDPETGDTLKSYDIPLDNEADVDTYFNAGGITTGFGSVWTTIFHDYRADDALVRLKK